MKITEDRTYITRVWEIEGTNTYTVTYSEGHSNFSWEILTDDHGDIDTGSDLGLRLISLCVEAMNIEEIQIKGSW